MNNTKAILIIQITFLIFSATMCIRSPESLDSSGKIIKYDLNIPDSIAVEILVYTPHIYPDTTTIHEYCFNKDIFWQKILSNRIAPIKTVKITDRKGSFTIDDLIQDIFIFIKLDNGAFAIRFFNRNINKPEIIVNQYLELSGYHFAFPTRGNDIIVIRDSTSTRTSSVFNRNTSIILESAITFSESVSAFLTDSTKAIISGRWDKNYQGRIYFKESGNIIRNLIFNNLEFALFKNSGRSDQFVLNSAVINSKNGLILDVSEKSRLEIWHTYFFNNQVVGLYSKGTYGPSVRYSIFQSNNIGYKVEPADFSYLASSIFMENNIGFQVASSPSSAMGCDFIDNYFGIAVNSRRFAAAGCNFKLNETAIEFNPFLIDGIHGYSNIYGIVDNNFIGNITHLSAWGTNSINIETSNPILGFNETQEISENYWNTTNSDSILLKFNGREYFRLDSILVSPNLYAGPK